MSRSTVSVYDLEHVDGHKKQNDLYVDGYSKYKGNRYNKNGAVRPMHEAETAYCGQRSKEIKKPSENVAVKPARFRFQCPRCRTRFSRPYTIKRHFPGCIRKHGNPLALKWLDGISGSYKYRVRRPHGSLPLGTPEALLGQTFAVASREQVASEVNQSL